MHVVSILGSLEGMATIENIMDHIANICNRDPFEIRMLNVLPSNKDKVKEITDAVLTSSDFDKRLNKVHKDNIVSNIDIFGSNFFCIL